MVGVSASGIAPGSNLLEALFKKHAPCLILIDEWVAYLRQVYKVEGLPSGSFDANLSFVQSLTEAVKASPGTLLVASLPASQIEVGGEGGQEALARLKQTFSRVESSWRPASQEESYEIVRRRLFKEIPGDKFHHRDNTLKQFAKMYRENANDFPLGCADEDYRRKLEKAYCARRDPSSLAAFYARARAEPLANKLGVSASGSRAQRPDQDVQNRIGCSVIS